MARLHPFGSGGLYVALQPRQGTMPNRVVVATVDANVAKSVGIVAFNREELRAAARMLLALAEELGPCSGS